MGSALWKLPALNWSQDSPLVVPTKLVSEVVVDVGGMWFEDEFEDNEVGDSRVSTGIDVEGELNCEEEDVTLTVGIN